MIEGLYVTITPDGIVKKYLSTRDGEVPFPDVSVTDELIAFAEENYLFLLLSKTNLFRLIHRSASDEEVIAEAVAICEKLKQRSILCGTLAYYEFLDYYHYWAPLKDYRRSRIADSAQYFGRAAIAWQVVMDTLERLSQGLQPDLRYKGALYFTVKPFGKPAKVFFVQRNSIIISYFSTSLSPIPASANVSFAAGILLPAPNTKRCTATVLSGMARPARKSRRI